jgi:hypothetical protein
METMRYVYGDHYPSEFQIKDSDLDIVDLTSVTSVTMEVTLDEATIPATSVTCSISSPTEGKVRGTLPTTLSNGMYRVAWVTLDISGNQVTYPTSDTQWLRIMSRYGV